MTRKSPLYRAVLFQQDFEDELRMVKGIEMLELVHKPGRNEALRYWKKCFPRGSHNSLERGLSISLYATVMRDKVIFDLTFAIPTAEALDTIAMHGPIIEIGAGTGYWAALLRERGVDVVAVDKAPPARTWTEVLCGGGVTNSRTHPDRTLFLCWPPMSDMAARALGAYVRAGGQKVIYVGEWAGGCTASTGFFKLLTSQFELVDLIEIPQWNGVHDCMYVTKLRGAQ